MSEEYYKPTLIQPKDLEIDGTDYNADLNVIKEGNTIKVTMDQDVMIQRVSHEIYSNFESGIRELVNNEYRACRQARDKYNAKPRLEITIDARTKELTIEGVDSLGISVRVFDKVLRCLGVSGNVDGGNEIGQFGMGFASYTTLSELITVETYSREDHQEFAFLGDRGIDFKILPKPSRETFGTKISLTCKDSVEFKSVYAKVKSCALFSTIPTVVTVLDDGKTDDSFTYSNDLTIGTEVLPIYNSGKEWCMEQYKSVQQQHNKLGESTRGLCDNGYAVGFYKEVHIDNEDYEFFGILSVNKNGQVMQATRTSSSYSSSNVRGIALLCNTPIESSIEPKGKWSAWYLNVKDERKYVPTADRDRLKDESSKTINAVLDHEIKEQFTGIGLEINSIENYNESIHKCILKNLYHYQDNMNDEEYLNSKKVMDTLDNRYNTINNRRLVMSDMLANGKTIVVLKSLRADMMSRLEGSLGVGKDIAFIRWKPSDVYDQNVESAIALMNECGVVWGEQYLKDNKIKGIKTPHQAQTIAEEAGCVLFHHGNHSYSDLFGTDTRYYVQKFSTTVGEVNEKADLPDNDKHRNNIMQVSKDDWRVFFDHAMNRNSGTPFCIMKPRKGISDNIESYTDIKEEYKTRKFLTLGGQRLTLAEIFIEDIDNTDGKEHVVQLIKCPKGMAKKVSALFKADEIVNSNSYRYVNDVIFCDTPKELLCVTAYVYQFHARSYGTETTDVTSFKTLFDDDHSNSSSLMSSTKRTSWECFVETELFRRTITKPMWDMFNVACSRDSTRGQEFMNTINEYK